MPDHSWDKFEWDDENKKNGNVQHLRDHRIEPEEAEECFSTIMNSVSTSVDSMMFTFWMGEPIAEEDCVSFFRTKVTGSLASLPVGI